MDLTYPTFTLPSLRYKFCPMCTTALSGTLDEEGILRAQCPTCGWTHFPCNVQTAQSVITTPEGVVFLLLDGAPPHCAAILPGGAVEYGETPEEAAVREAREETGLEVEIVRGLGRTFYRDFPFGPTLGFMFEARMVGGTLRDGLEGRAAIFREGEFPIICPELKLSRSALDAYMASKELPVDPYTPTRVERWHGAPCPYASCPYR